jgi:hypothetical protein
MQIARPEVANTRPCLRYATLFTSSSFAQVVSRFFVNLSSVAERKYPDEPGLAIDCMDDRAY